jgi:CHAT domain-containing protein
MNKHMALIDRFRCGIELDHPPNEQEIELINSVCNSPSTSNGLAILRSASQLLSGDGLKMLSSCALGLWQDMKRPDMALVVSIWAVEAARLLSDYKAEASILLMHIGLLLSNRHYNAALEAIKRGKALCSEYSEVAQLAGSFAEAEQTVRLELAKISIQDESACDICSRSFRVYDGAKHVVLSRKHTSFTKAAHCFACSIVICFGCAVWVQSLDAQDVSGEISKDLKTPCCPFCRCPLGSPDEIPEPLPFPIDSSDLMLSTEIKTALNSIMVVEDRNIIISILTASSLKEALVAIRASLGIIKGDFDTELKEAAARSKASSQIELADVFVRLLQAIQWVRDKQNTPKIQTRDMYEMRLQEKAATAEEIEQQLTRANLLLARNDLSRAINEAERALQASLELGDKRRLARSFLIKGLIYQDASRIQDAKKEFEQALQIAQEAGQDLIAAKANGNLAKCYLTEPVDENQSLKHSQEALRLYRNVGDEIGIARTVNNIGSIYLRREDAASALPYFDEAYHIKKKLEDWTGAANTVGNIAIAQNYLGHCDIALNLANEAVALARLGDSSLDLLRHLNNVATFAAEAEDYRLAIDNYEECLILLEKTRSKISDKYLRDNLIKDYRAGFHNLAKLYLKQGDPDNCVGVLERMASVGLCEFMTHPGIAKMTANHPAGEYIADFPLPHLKAIDVWSIVNGSTPTAIIKYAFVGDDLYSFLALPNSTTGSWLTCSFPNFNYDALAEWFVQPPMPGSPYGGGWFGPLHDFRGAIKGHIFQFDMTKAAFELFMRDRLIAAWETMLLELGTNLFAPLVGHIRKAGARRILFVPIGVLTEIPLHAMLWEEEGSVKCVIDEFDVHFAPSLRVYAQAALRPATRMESALLIADPGCDMPLARYECEKLASILSSHKLLEGAEATFECISRIAPDFDIVHCATHGLYNPSSVNLCGICLAFDKDKALLEKGEFVNSQGSILLSPVNASYHLATIPQIFDCLGLRPGSLVFLSACDSGNVMPDYRGEDFISLSAGFLATGASAVICSQWPVDSMTAALFSLLFYCNLEANDCVAALNSAQRELRSLTAEMACKIWNSHRSDLKDFDRLDISMLAEILGRPLSQGIRPFESTYFWASFSLWGLASGPRGKHLKGNKANLLA